MTPTLEKTLNFLEEEYDFAAREKPLYDKINSLNAEEVLEKFVLAERLVDEKLRFFLLSGNNVFE